MQILIFLDATCIGFGNCSGNGLCNLRTGKCECDTEFYGTDCQCKLYF